MNSDPYLFKVRVLSPFVVLRTFQNSCTFLGIRLISAEFTLRSISTARMQ